jgi:hypothetical protein
MSGIYKSLQPKDVRTTPYRAHKTIATSFSGDVSPSGECKVYVAAHTPSSSYDFYQQGFQSLDAGNPYFTGNFLTTTDGYYQTAIHSQLDHLFYREYLNNNKATLGGGAPITFQYRDLGYKAKVISFGTLKVGEGILPETVQLSASGYTVVDDKYGNLIFSEGGSNGITTYDAADYDNVMFSHTFNRQYYYVGEGPISQHIQNVTYGSYKLFTSYSNVAYTLVDNSGSVAASFKQASGSVIVMSAGTELKQVYNKSNSDYAIAFRFKARTTPAATSSMVILAKQDRITDYAVDLEGNIFTDTNTPSQYPYKIEFDSSSKLKFTKSNTQTTVTAQSNALTLNTYYDVVIQRTGSKIDLWVDGTKQTSVTDTFMVGAVQGTTYNIKDQECANRCNLYIGNSYDITRGLDGEIMYMHMFDRALSDNEIDNLDQNFGWLGNYCGNVFYNLGLCVLTHPKLVNTPLDLIRVKGTLSMRETEVYCTVGPNEFNVTHNRSIQYWNPVSNQFEIDTRYQTASFRPYVTTVGLYNDRNELLAVAKLSTPIQTSEKTDTTFVIRYDY